MFKSAFVKYLTAIVLIMLISFSTLSAIIAFTIRSYAVITKQTNLENTSLVIQSQIESKNIEDLKAYATFGAFQTMASPLLKRDPDIDLILTDKTGRVFLTTIGAKSADGDKQMIVTGDLGDIDTRLFSKSVNDEGNEFVHARGSLDGFLPGNYILYGRAIKTGNEIGGYILALSSTTGEDALSGVIQRAVITSSVWVLLASLIAVYFITERIIHPLRSMTVAAKKFAKGDFDTRVTVYGNDEVSQLGVAFNNMAESLDNLEKMRSSFLASVSHDLRTPMTVISGFIDGINSGAIPPEKQEHYLNLISSEMHRLSRLVGQLLDLSRFESGDKKMNFSDFDLAELARIALISLEKKIEDKHLDVFFACDEEDEFFVHADKDAIHQVVYNLMHNATKFSNDGAKFEITIKRNGKAVELSVYNEGVGISKDDLPFVFDRFYKIDKSRGLDKTGVGLGLYICKTIMDAHGENITVESEEGVYCRFSFTLPAVESPRRKGN